jgi:3-hydroxyacyl-[acyl-carrier-protein] dehydratase
MRWILVDKIIEMDPGKSVVGVRNFSRSESFFMDHFPGFPVVPGVLHVEMIAQAGGLSVMAANPGILPVLGTIKSAKFYHKIVPGDQAVIKVQVVVRKEFSVASGQIEVEGKKISAAELILAHIPMPENLIRRVWEDGVLSDWRKTGVHESNNME